MNDLASSFAMLAAIVLGVAGARLVLTGRDRTKGTLMLVAAAVLIGNVIVLTV